MARSYEVQEFGARGLTRAESSDISALHEELLSHSPLVKLGKVFMEQFYYSVLSSSGSIRGAIAYVDDRPAGFIVATNDAGQFMSKAARKHPVRLVSVLFKSVITDPRRANGMIEAYRIQANVSSVGYGPGFGELLSFGVLPAYRARNFIVETGLQIAADLQDVAMRQLGELGVRTVRACVDCDNLPAQFFYRAHGWRLGEPAVPGWSVPTMEFLFDIEEPGTPNCAHSAEPS